MRRTGKPDPYPECVLGQAKSLENAKYTRSIRQHTLKTAILDQARKPPGAFKDVIEAHMRLRAGKAYPLDHRNVKRRNARRGGGQD